MEADYVVVGAGSAGCAVACRLVQAGARVTLLEAGPEDRQEVGRHAVVVPQLLHHDRSIHGVASCRSPVATIPPGVRRAYVLRAAD